MPEETALITSRMLPNFSSISQFAPGLPTGLCGPTATLGALSHAIGNQGYTMNRAGLEKIYAFERAHNLIEADGGQNIYSAYRAVQLLWPHPGHLLYGYGQVTPDGFTTSIREWAGIRAIIVEYSNGQALLGDEWGVHYHFDSIGGISSIRPVEGWTGGYATCDGDSSHNLPDNAPVALASAQGQGLWHARQTLLSAVPIAYIVCAQVP